MLLWQKLSEVPEQTSNRGAFSVSGKLLPSYITMRTAERILFVGESVHMFSSQGRPRTLSREVGKFTGTQASSSALHYELSFLGVIWFNWVPKDRKPFGDRDMHRNRHLSPRDWWCDDGPCCWDRWTKILVQNIVTCWVCYFKSEFITFPWSWERRLARPHVHSLSR